MERHLPALLLCAAGLLAGATPARAGETSAQAPEAASSASAGTPTEADPRQFLLFVEEFTGSCVSRNGVQVLIRNTHPSRPVRVWLDRFHAGQGTGDRSRSDLPPGGEPEPLGCSRNHNAPQEWRVVRAAFID
jgi:hypothetical protein